MPQMNWSGLATMITAAAAIGAATTANAQWTANGNSIYYNAGNVGFRTNNPGASAHAISATAPSSIAILGAGYAGAAYSIGIRGISYASTGYGGLFDGGRYGILTRAQAASGETYGLWSQVNSPTGTAGVFKGGRYAVYGETTVPNSYAAYFLGRAYFSSRVGIGTTNPLYKLHVFDTTIGAVGVAGGTSGVTNGVQGRASSPDGFGVYGTTTATTGVTAGVYGDSFGSTTTGVAGDAFHTSGENFGVYGRTASPNGWGVYSDGDSGSSGFKAFNIDHPLDPANQYLNHFSAEGPEALLIYRGNAILDESGEAWAELPSYFEAINKDVSYTLTAVGAPAPMLHVAEEVKANRFRIAGGKPGMKVCWVVTGARNDPYARAHAKPVEQLKPVELRNTYIHPQLYNMPATAARSYRRAAAGQVLNTAVIANETSKPHAAPAPIVDHSQP